MQEQKFLIDGERVTFLVPELIPQETAELWYRDYKRHGECSYGLKQHAPGVWEIGKGIMTGDAGAEMYAKAIKDKFNDPVNWKETFKQLKDMGCPPQDKGVTHVTSAGFDTALGWVSTGRNTHIIPAEYNAEPPYVEHLNEAENEASENYGEYIQYVQKLDTELTESRIFIQDRMNEIGLELAGIEEQRMDLSAKEFDLERQMAYLKTLKSLTYKRQEELHGEVEQKRHTSIPREIRGTEMDEKQG